MKFTSSTINTLLSRVPPQYHVYMFYGQNYDAIKKYTRLLIDNINHNSSQSLVPIVVDGEQLHKNPSLLLEEWREVPMFYDKKVIIIENLTEKLYPLLVNFLKYPQNLQFLNNFLIIQGENLTSLSKIKIAFDNHKGCASIGCYIDYEKDAQKMIRGYLSKNNIRMDSNSFYDLIQDISIYRYSETTLYNILDSIVALHENCSNITYTQGISYYFNNSRNEDYTNIVDRLFSGDFTILNNKDIIDDKFSLFILVFNHILLLKSFIKQTNEGKDLQSIFQNAKIHFKRKPYLEKQIKMWSTHTLEALLEETIRLNILHREKYSLHKHYTHLLIMEIRRIIEKNSVT